MTFDPRHDPERKVMYIVVLIDGIWAAEIWHDDCKNQGGDAMHVVGPDGCHLYGGRQWQPKSYWDCKMWCLTDRTLVDYLDWNPIAAEMSADELEDTSLTW